MGNIDVCSTTQGVCVFVLVRISIYRVSEGPGARQSHPGPHARAARRLKLEFFRPKRANTKKAIYRPEACIAAANKVISELLRG